MAKRDRILGCFPSFYRATDRTKLLHEVVTNLARPLDDADTHLFRIQRAHRLTVAEHIDDIIRLAASLNLTAFHFEDIQSDPTLSYQAKLELMRARTQRVARINLKGLGTPWAVMEATAIFLNAQIVPERAGDPLIKHLDANYFSHKAIVEFTHREEKVANLEAALQVDLDAGGAPSDTLSQALVNTGIPLQGNLVLDIVHRGSTWRVTSQGDGRIYMIRKQGGVLNVYGRPRERIYLHENLFHRRKVEPVDHWQLNSWVVANSNSEPAAARFVIQGVSDHTVRPSIFCPATGEGLWFNGAVPAGKTLVADAVNGAFLDGQPADDWLVSFKGGIHDFARSDATHFVREQGGSSSAPFLGVLEEVAVSAIRRPSPLPEIPIGRSEWVFKVADGLYDASDFDLAVFEAPTHPVGSYDGDLEFDECVFDYPGAGIVGMGWDESIPCSFKVLLPPEPPKAAGGAKATPVNFPSRVGAILPGFKAAGIRALVDTARDAWILGESVVRTSAATEGEGVTRRATRLRNQHTDRLVPLDAITQAGAPRGDLNGG